MLYNLVQRGALMAHKTTGARYRLGEPLSTDLSDFCAAMVGTAEIKIIRDALRMYIDYRLANEPELRKRFEASRRDRIGDLKGGNVVVMPKRR